MCLQGKRAARERRKMQISNIGFWESWRRSQSIHRKRVWAQVGGALSGLLPWQNTLRKIEGRFGVGVKAYFVFLRYLIYLNLLHCFLICGFILVPTGVYSRAFREPLRFGGNDSVLDFVLGTHTWTIGKRHSMNVSFKIFCGWDFTIQDPAAAQLKKSFVRNDLKLFLEEQSFSLRKAQRTLGQKLRLYLLRFILNLVVLSLLGGAFYLIYFSTIRSRGENISSFHWLVGLVLQYLPPMTISFVNIILPHMFRKISSFEDYSLTVQVNATLVRSIFLKLASLGIYLSFLFLSPPKTCRENQFGREMYKLCVFNFLATFCNAFLFNYPRKLLQEARPTSLLARLSGKQHFLIPFNVLDLVYGQTVSWVGVHYCPLLPLIGTRMFRASSSSVLFHLMLLLGLLMAATALGFNLYQQEHSKEFSCGPFGGGESVFEVVRVCVRSLPGPAQTAVRYLTSEAFALPLLLAEVIVLTSYVSRQRANQRAIDRLKDMLSSSDKRFLVKQHTTLLRDRRNRSRGRSAAAQPDAHQRL
ncbi:unnamed protein product [Menidia menidia]|uniref:Transmembrane channel-like protein n=1 Tax=Menidia menidia TaxID=238744 RepID=A0A8S4B3X9_9TELE|nr:unnamed protein product [Menidia menidia]